MPGITLIAEDKRKLGGAKGSWRVLSGGSCEVSMYGSLEDDSEEME